MLDKYLEIQAREQEKVASRDQFVERLMLLPNEELFEVQRTGEIKLAYCSDILSSDSDRKTWLDHFKGSPLYAQAIALEEEELKMQAADDQSDQVETAERATKRQARDALRLEKRLLELELVKSEQAAESAALPPPEPSPGMGAPPMGAQGAGAPGDVPPTEIGKMASIFKAAAEKKKKEHAKGTKMNAGQRVGSLLLGGPGGFFGAAKGAPHGDALGGFLRGTAGSALGGGIGSGIGTAVGEGVGGEGGALLGSVLGTLGGGYLGYKGLTSKYKDKKAAENSKKHHSAHDSGEFLGRHLHHGAALYGASEGAKKYHGTAKAMGYGRKGRLAGAALGALTGGAVGHSVGRLAQGVAHGASHAKDKEKEAGVGDFLRAAAPVVGDFVKKHPGAAIGGGIGALHGLMHQGGGLGSAVLEGAGGAALGHGAEHMYRSGSLQGIKDAVMPATGGVAKEAAALPPFGDEKRAFIGSMLGALGGAAARGGAGGLMSGGLKGLGGTAMNWIKSNPMKAVGGAMNAASNFTSARQQGQGLGGAALSGLAGGASALG